VAATMLRAPQSGRQQAQDGRSALAGAVALPAFAAAVVGFCGARGRGFVNSGRSCELAWKPPGGPRFLRDRGLPQRTAAGDRGGHVSAPRLAIETRLRRPMSRSGDRRADSPNRVRDILVMLDDLRAHLGIPTQTCVLAHVSTRDCHIAMGRARSACGIDAVGPDATTTRTSPAAASDNSQSRKPPTVRCEIVLHGGPPSQQPEKS